MTKYAFFGYKLHEINQLDLAEKKKTKIHLNLIRMHFSSDYIYLICL